MSGDDLTRRRLALLVEDLDDGGAVKAPTAASRGALGAGLDRAFLTSPTLKPGPVSTVGTPFRSGTRDAR